MMSKKWLVLLAIVGVLCFSSMASADDWKYGLGTGPLVFNVDGDISFDRVAISGKALVDVSESGDEVLKNMFRLEGYATNKDWLFQFKWGEVEIIDELSNGILTSYAGGAGNWETGDIIARTELNRDSAEISAGYLFFDDLGFQSRFYAGLRYTRHQVKIYADGFNIHPGFYMVGIDEQWLDPFFGFSIDIPVLDNLKASANADYAMLGGSDLTYGGTAGIDWAFYENWSAKLFGRYYRVDYSDGRDWTDDHYKYDVKEISAGLTIMYNF